MDVCSRHTQDLGVMSLAEFAKLLGDEVASKAIK